MIRNWAAAAGIVAALFCGGCGRKEQPVGGGSSSTPSVIRVGNGDELQALDPQTITGVPEYRVLHALFEGLASMDPKDLHPVPGLAESWDISPDGLVYTFHLRPNLKWSNGDPITADDYVQSYRRILTPAFAAEYAYLLYNFVQGAREYYDGKITDFSKVGFKALDPRTLQVTLMHPTPYLLSIIAQHQAWDVVPVKYIAKFGPLDRRDTAWTRAGNLVGNGPYLLKSWVLQQKIVVTRNPYYWDAPNVKTDEIEFYPIQDTTTEEMMFRDGQLDITEYLPSSKVEVYRREHPEELHVDPALIVEYYECNVTRPPLNDKRVRKALAMAIDRDAIVREVTKSGEQPAYALGNPLITGYVPRAHLEENVAEAQRLLAEAGFPGGRGFPVIQLIYNTLPRHRETAEAIQAMWRKNLGIEIQLQNEEWKVYEDATQHHFFQMARAGWEADYIDPQPFFEIWETGNGNNFTLWSNPEYDRLLHSALQAKDDAARYECYQRMDEILMDECPIIPLYYWTRVYATNPKIKDYWPTLLDWHPWKYVYREP